jgi:transcriptional regulator with XRE-family HTH domain
MWLENLKELKKKTEMSSKQIADKSRLPERTVARIFSGETDHPRIDTLGLIADAMGVTLRDIFADTNVIVATETLTEVKEVAEIVEAERDEVAIKNEMLEAKVNALTMEIELLTSQLQHKDELLSVHKQYLAIIKSNIKVDKE